MPEQAEQVVFLVPVMQRQILGEIADEFGSVGPQGRELPAAGQFSVNPASGSSRDRAETSEWSEAYRSDLYAFKMQNRGGGISYDCLRKYYGWHGRELVSIG